MWSTLSPFLLRAKWETGVFGRNAGAKVEGQEKSMWGLRVFSDLFGWLASCKWEKHLYIVGKSHFLKLFFPFFFLSLSHSLSSVFFSLFTLVSTTTPHLLLAAKAYLLSYILHFSLPSSFFFPLKISFKVKSFLLYLYYPLSLWIHYHYHYQIRSKYLRWSATALWVLGF